MLVLKCFKEACSSVFQFSEISATTVAYTSPEHCLLQVFALSKSRN